MEIDYDTLIDLAGADGHCLGVPLIILDYLYVDAPWYKPRFIKDAVPKRPRPVVYGIENPYLIPEFYDIPYLGPMHIVPSAFYGRKAIFERVKIMRHFQYVADVCIAPELSHTIATLKRARGTFLTLITTTARFPTGFPSLP